MDQKRYKDKRPIAKQVWPSKEIMGNGISCFYYKYIFTILP